MLTAAFGSMLQQIALPGIAIILSTIASRYLESRGKAGLAAFVSCSSAILMVVLWLLPTLDGLSVRITQLMGLGSTLSAPSMPFAAPCPGEWGRMTADMGALMREVDHWGAGALQSGQSIVRDILLR